MESSKATSILASFTTMKSLFDAKTYQNPYQLLSEFISYIIVSDKIRSFTAVEMKNRLETTFGFDIPEAVVNTSTRNLGYVTRKNNQFLINSSILNADPVFAEKRQEAENVRTDIIDRLSAFVKEKDPKNMISPEVLTQEFVAFLVDDESKPNSKYTELISQFILKNEEDDKVRSALKTIREGSILYIGLNHNINETGSIRKPLTLYLGTEVLFSLYGLNGEIHKRLAYDLYEQVKNANSVSKKIHLRYFAETKKEIHDFFTSAESIIAGKTILNDTVAMKAIINGCDTVSDVKVKEADFFHNLEFSFGIKEDESRDYYSTDNNVYNLESLTTDEAAAESMKFISHINKLRKGRIFNSNTDAEYLFITNSRNTINASNNQSKEDKIKKSLENVSDYAVSVDKITNLLWYKLGNGFGRKEYPSNVDAVLKARVLLASHISQNISKVYAETRIKYKAGELSDEQLASRIITLRGKTTIPEDLDADTIDDSLNFSTEYLIRFEEEVVSSRTALQEKEKIIKTLKDSNEETIVEKDSVIAQKDKQIQEMDEQKKNLEAELEIYRNREKKKASKKERRKQVGKLVWSIIWKLLIVAVVTIIAVKICGRIGFEFTSIVCAVVDILGLIMVVGSTFKKEKGKYFPNDSDENR